MGGQALARSSVPQKSLVLDVLFLAAEKVPKKGAQERGSAQTVWLKLIVLTGKERGAPARCQGATKITFKREIL